MSGDEICAIIIKAVTFAGLLFAMATLLTGPRL